MATKLTQKHVDAINPTGKRHALFDTDVKGLNLVVGATGNKVWWFDYRNRDRQKRRIKIGTTDLYKLTAARAEAKKLVGRIAQGEDPVGEKQQAKADALMAESRTVQAFLEGKYWDRHLAHAKSGKATRARLTAAWEPIMDTDMSALTVAQVTKHRANRLKAGKSAATLNRDRVALIALLNKAVELEIIPANPLKLWKPLKLENDRRVRYLGERDEREDFRDDAGNKIGEQARFSDALKRQPGYIQAIVTLALNTGMRRGEILQLKWSDVSLQRREIVLRASTTKTGTRRHLPLNKAAMRALEAWKSELDNVVNLHGLVFPGPTGGPMFSIKKAWATQCRDAQVTDFRLHDCRHDFCSRLVMSGISLYTVRDLAGHSSITLTERYAHLAPQVTRGGK